MSLILKTSCTGNLGYQARNSESFYYGFPSSLFSIVLSARKSAPPFKKRTLSNSAKAHDKTDDAGPHLNKVDLTLDAPIRLELDVIKREGEDTELIGKTAPASDNNDEI